MFYVSSVVNGLWGIKDTDDNVEEFYTESDILSFLNKGIKIQGVVVSSNKVHIQVVDFNDSAIEMAKRLIVDSIWRSANLEGLGTTFPKTEAILENKPVNTSRDEVLFIVNMKSAWSFLLDNVSYENNLMFLRHLNKLVGESLFYGNGDVRKSIVTIGGTDWIPDIPIEGVIIEKLQELSSIEDAELRALKLFCFVARTQIFIDGNKRVAQLIANKVLIESNIGVFQIPIRCIEDFKGLLLSFYETGDDAEIIKFMQSKCINRVRP